MGIFLDPEADAIGVLGEAGREKGCCWGAGVVGGVAFDCCEADVCYCLEFEGGGGLFVYGHAVTVDFEVFYLSLVLFGESSEPVDNHVAHKFEFGSVSKHYVGK